MPHSAVRPTAPTTDPSDARFVSVERRDKAADGTFVFAVGTTGIFCKPSCPSRRALRQNIQFFDTCEAAERAGFRACKRCRPEDQGTEDAALAAGIRAVCRHIETAETMPSLDELATLAGLSRFHFHRTFKAAMGVTPRQYATAVRRERVASELRDGASVADAIYGAGYNSSSRFYEESAAALGMTASAFRDRGRGEVILYATATSTLGRVLVAVTAKGVCAITFGDADEALSSDLARRFANADIRGPEPTLAKTLAAVLDAVETPGATLALPLDIRGTAFQARVWEALRAIPPGETQSYAEVARRIGQPKAVRAVAGACAANALAVVVPCHRVVRGDGDLSGYRWGRERKAEILRREALEKPRS